MGCILDGMRHCSLDGEEVGDEVDHEHDQQRFADSRVEVGD